MTLEDLAKYEDILNSMVCGALILDDQLMLVSWNARAVDLLGGESLSCEMSLSDLVSNFEDGDGFLECVSRVLKLQLPEEKTLCLEGGLACQFLVNPNSGVGAGCLLVTFMPSGGALSERERFLRAMDSAGMVWWEWDLSKGKLTVTAGGDCILGYPCDGLPDSAEIWFTKVHPEDGARVLEWLQNLNLSKGESVACEHRFLRGDAHSGKWNWVEQSGVVLRRSSDGAPMLIEGMTRNIHEKKQIQSELSLSREHADSALKIREDFLSLVNHETRTPLNAIQGTAQLLEADCSEEDISEYARDILRASDRLLQIFENLVSFSRREGSLEVCYSRFDLSQLMDDVVRLVCSIADVSRSRLEVLFSDRGDSVFMDESRLRLVLTNVIENAIKYSDPDSRVLVSLNRVDQFSKNWEFVVEDSGIGIEPEHLEHVFEPFYQSDRSETRRHGGMGIGLSIAREMVHLMGGEIFIDSRVGEGTRVCFTATEG